MMYLYETNVQTMLYCYMNDEILNINYLCFICKKNVYVLSSSTHYKCFHLLLQLIGIRVDHKLWSTLHVIQRLTFIYTCLSW